MSIETISNETRKARKRRRCTWCGQWIEVGQTYIHERVKVEGDPATNDLHPECDDALRETARLEGGECTYNLYSEERPEKRT